MVRVDLLSVGEDGADYSLAPVCRSRRPSDVRGEKQLHRRRGHAVAAARPPLRRTRRRRA